MYSLMSFDTCIQSCNHHYNQDIEHFQSFKKFPFASLKLTPFLVFLSLETTDLFFVTTVLIFLDFPINGLK